MLFGYRSSSFHRVAFFDNINGALLQAQFIGMKSWDFGIECLKKNGSRFFLKMDSLADQYSRGKEVRNIRAA